jgi:hypothetical protein
MSFRHSNSWLQPVDLPANARHAAKATIMAAKGAIAVFL